MFKCDLFPGLLHSIHLNNSCPLTCTKGSSGVLQNTNKRDQTHRRTPAKSSQTPGCRRLQFLRCLAQRFAPNDGMPDIPISPVFLVAFPINDRSLSRNLNVVRRRRIVASPSPRPPLFHFPREKHHMVQSLFTRMVSKGIWSFGYQSERHA